MPGRRPTSAKMLDNDTLHISNEELEERIKAEPSYQSQNFELPSELYGEEEIAEWKSLVKTIREFENTPIADCDKTKMIMRCKAIVSFNKADKAWNENPQYWVEVEYTDEHGRRKTTLKVNENYKIRKDMMGEIAKLDSDLMLDPISRAKIGKARIDSKKKNNAVEDIYNRQGN